MSPGATPAQIRAAYRRRAFELHPDRLADRTPAAVAAAEERMAELNEAFARLTGGARPATRDSPRPTAAPTARAAASTTGGSPFPPAGPTSPTGPSPSPMAVLATVAPWVALLLVLGGIFVFTAYAGRGDEGDGPDGPGATVAIRDVRGSCIQESGGFTLVVNCGVLPNEGRIVAQASIGARCPEGTVEWVIPQSDFLACTEPTAPAP